MAYRKAVDKKEVPNNALKCMVDALHHIRRHMSDVQDTSMLPVPYPYFHLLSMMLVCNLALWAYCMGLADSIFSPVVFTAAASIFMGLMELASQLSAPFGDDDVDFPIEQWLTDVSRDTFALSEYHFLDDKGFARTIATEKRFEHQARDTISKIIHNFLDAEQPCLNFGADIQGPSWKKREAAPSPPSSGLDIRDGTANDEEDADSSRALQQTLIVRDKTVKSKPQFVKMLHNAHPEEYTEYVPLKEQQEDEEDSKIPTCSFICAVANQED
mmetsp:Transcript_155461/g.270358  ORF Transcript_155461/g.270358 Transcript_155461/m.270358 type:complete len:271 (+) Transcript_155461:167-979(+)